MKIAICRSQFYGPVSGADEILLTYAVCLRRAGHDVDVVLLYKPTKDDRFCQRLRQADVQVLHVVDRSLAFSLLRGVRNLLSSVLLLFMLVPRSEQGLRRIWQVLIDWISRTHYGTCRAYFARSGYSVLHVFTPDIGTALMIRAGKAAGIPVLYHEMGTPQYLPALDGYYRRLAGVLPLCTEVAALSPLLAQQWSERFPFLSPVTVLPLIAEDLAMLNVSTPASGDATREIIFGYAARIEPGKGPLVLAEALALVRRHRSDVVVRVAGIGPSTQEVQTRVRELGLDDAWEFVGAYTGAVGGSAFMRTLDAFVLPSFAEGTSKSVIEAMSHSLPSITTTVGGLPDLITSESGILIPPGDAKALADAMLRLAADQSLRDRMGRAARERYLALFSPDVVLSLLMSTYARVAGGRRAGPAPPVSSHPWAQA